MKNLIGLLLRLSWNAPVARAEKMWRHLVAALAALVLVAVVTAVAGVVLVGQARQIDDAVAALAAQQDTTRTALEAADAYLAAPDTNPAALKAALIGMETATRRTLDLTEGPSRDRIAGVLQRIELLTRALLSGSLNDPVAVRASLGAAVSEGLQPALDALRVELDAAQAESKARIQVAIWIGLGVFLLALALTTFLVLVPSQMTLVRLARNLQDSAAVQRLKQSQLDEADAARLHAASHDPLTDLPNRLALIGRLEDAIEERPDRFCLLSIDVARFRAINDSLGQAVGDELLKHVARLLKRSTGREDCVARTGSDEFAILTIQDPERLCETLLRHFDEPVTVAGRICQTGLSIGILRLRRGDRDPRLLLANADLAQHHARRMGRNTYSTYSRNLRQTIADRDALAVQLPGAIADGQIVPFYQPQISLQDGRLAGVEILARWRHPDRGLIPPDVFLSIAETAGIARELDHRIWNQAMRQLRRWNAEGVALPQISLNAAPDTIADPQMVPTLLEFLRDSGVLPSQIMIEVLETTFIGEIYDAAAMNIERLIGAGILVELDDFGTGYTSLSTLIQLNLSGIKLDRSLVSPLPARSAQSVIRAVMALAKELGLHVVAEGIETAEQAEFLAELDCDIGQGYIIGKPMNARDFAEWVKLWQAAEDAAGGTADARRA